MEALVCGPLVIADTMLVPPKGLLHGETIVFFETLQELEEVVMYCLTHEEERRAIAQQGWRLAMGRYRSWHRIEELFFAGRH
jgi:spore maturation protein CgeB